METYTHVCRCHWLNSANSGDYGYSGEFPVLPRKKITCEDVGKQMFLEEFLDYRGKHRIAGFWRNGRNTLLLSVVLPAKFVFFGIGHAGDRG